MEGIKETKEVLDFVLALGNALGKAYEDGELKLADALHFVPILSKAGPAFGDISKIAAELKDLSDEERQALTAYAKASFDIPDDKLESSLEMALEVGFYLAKLIAEIKG